MTGRSKVCSFRKDGQGRLRWEGDNWVKIWRRWGNTACWYLEKEWSGYYWKVWGLAAHCPKARIRPGWWKGNLPLFQMPATGGKSRGEQISVQRPTPPCPDSQWERAFIDRRRGYTQTRHSLVIGGLTSDHLGTVNLQIWASLVGQLVKNPLAMQETPVWFRGWEDPLDEGMATHSSILAWRIPLGRGVWQAAVHRVTKSRTRLSD